jgi:3D (Asp-Asp-Asp) domain-containing protein
VTRRLALAIAALIVAYAVVAQLGDPAPDAPPPMPSFEPVTVLAEPDTMHDGGGRTTDGRPSAAASAPAPKPVAAPRRDSSKVRIGKLSLPRITGSAPRRAAVGEAVPVTVTIYCLRGRTRRDTYVRNGIIAVDPRVSPLGSEIDLWIRGTYLGRFDAEDTGRLIKGARIDIWRPDCKAALQWGRKKGVARLVK